MDRTTMQSEFLDIGFDRCIYAKTRISLADEFSKGNRCGIYIFQFDNGDFYVGQAVDVVRRFAQHRKYNTDIEYISFKQVPKERLSEVERETVFELENRKRVLRNINIVSVVQGDTDLDLIIPKNAQDFWFTNFKDIRLDTERFEYPELRKRYTDRHNKFKDYEYYDEVVGLLQSYILSSIPFPRKTEYSFWACTLLPGGNVLVRVNIFWQEIFCIREYIFDNPETNEKEVGLDVVFYVSKLILQKYYTYEDLLKEFQSLEFGNNIYKPAGQDQQQIMISASEYFDFFFKKGVWEAAKVFNLNLMRKGGCNSNRYHCFDLADEALRVDNIEYIDPK